MLKKNLLLNSILSVSQFLFPLITFPYSSRILGPEGIGAVNFIDSITQYFILLSALGIPVYGIREVAKHRGNPEALNKIFSEVLLIHIVSTIAFAAIYFTMAMFIPALANHLSLVIIGVLLILFSVFSIEWFYQGMEKFSYITTRSLIIRTLSIAALFIFLKPGSHPVVYYSIMCGIVLLTAILNLWNIKKFVSFRFHQLEFVKHLKPLAFIFGSVVAATVYVLLDNIILGFIQGVVAVGIYSTAIRIVRLPFAFIGAINAVMVPQISRAHSEGNNEVVQSCINKSFAFICIVGLPLSIGIFISSSFVVTSFAGEKFANAALVLQVLTPVIMLVGFNSILGTQVLTPFGKEKILLKCVSAGMVFSLVMNFILIPFLSYTGAAITNVLTEILVTALCLYFVNRLKITFNKKIFFQALLGAALFIPIAFIVRQLNISYIPQEIIIIVACAFTYAAYVWFFVRNEYVENIKLLVLDKIKFSK